jgi:hypothetical protein
MRAAVLVIVLAAAPGASQRSLPDNPCEILEATDIAIAGQLVVQAGRRVPSIRVLAEVGGWRLEAGSRAAKRGRRAPKNDPGGDRTHDPVIKSHMLYH